MRYLFLLILIAGSVGVFVKLVQPMYANVQNLRSEVSTSGGSLSTAGIIKKQRDDLIAKYHSISKTDLDSLNALLPDSVNNIRLIIQMNALANKNNLSTLRSVDYQTGESKDKNTQYLDSEKPYGEFLISFQTTGQYKNFLTFISDLESNLRLVDIVGIDFSSSDGEVGGTTSMSYKVTLKTYWLKQ
jgi:Tfp pilus assembly protein PilO